MATMLNGISKTDSTNASIDTEIVAIGISFGNSNSSIAYTTSDGKVEVIANEEGDRQIPSVLAYVDGEEYHGTQAKSQLVRNASNTVTHFRDFLGRDFDHIDPTHCHASAHPHRHDSTVAFSVHDLPSKQDTKSTVSVSEISTRHIRRLAQSASDYLGKTVNAAVLTVPTNMDQAQKDALAAACAAAKVQVLQMISEPTAAILAYDARMEKAQPDDKMVVVADLGGTRSDVAVVACRAGLYSILASKHDTLTSGTQLDQVLVDHFAKEFIKKHSCDPRQDARSLAKLKLQAEATKKALSLGGNASLSVESLADGIDFSSTINRTRYELLAAKDLSNFTRLIQETITAAGLDVLDIDEVILSGGTSHTPRVSSNLATIFPAHTRIIAPATLPNAIDPSSLAARGAAIQASLVSQYEQEDIDQSTHPKVTVVPHLAHTIGLLLVTDDVARGVFHPLLLKDSAIPCQRTALIPVPKAGGDVLIKLCEGCRTVKVSQPPPKAIKAKSAASETDDTDSDEEAEEIRENVWRIGSIIGEAAVRDVPKAGKAEITVKIAADQSVQFSARPIGGKGGVRGSLVIASTATTGTA